MKGASPALWRARCAVESGNPTSTGIAPMLPQARPANRNEVPVLDLTPLVRGEPIDGLASELRRACETIGFFYVTNHGVPRPVIDAAFEATRRYFALPVEQRMKDKIDER